MRSYGTRQEAGEDAVGEDAAGTAMVETAMVGTATEETTAVGRSEASTRVVQHMAGQDLRRKDAAASRDKPTNLAIR